MNPDPHLERTGKVQIERLYGLDGPEPDPHGPGGIIFQASNELHNVTNVGSTPATTSAFRPAMPAPTTHSS